MKIVKEEYNIKCDVISCKNTSAYAIEVDDNRRHDVHLCESCFDTLYSLMSHEKTPKGVENLVRKAENRRNEWKGR